ncbi:hypothetical protein CPS_1124 [Colwellia psychrerythraea 34H]|uniref:Uncharacterized protein n=1 Tax=Colwellia psychrerythraea (strain 34H / ATCC BAA-681) TaxID=167879 RepID=Q486Z8_COLP3|nr:hypothetical protein CPS_1124 [Colwellia psychrerythraea 34H]
MVGVSLIRNLFKKYQANTDSANENVGSMEGRAAYSKVNTKSITTPRYLLQSGVYSATLQIK